MVTSDQRKALEAAIPLLRNASMLTRLGAPAGLAGHVLAVGIDVAVDDAVELLLPDRVTPRPPSPGDDPVALLRAAERLLAQSSSVGGDRMLGDLCDQLVGLVAEAAAHAAD